MYISENCAQEALKNALTLVDAQQLASECAKRVATELQSYNQNYVLENKNLEENFDYVPSGDARYEPAVQVLSRCYLTLLHRRGLVGL